MREMKLLNLKESDRDGIGNKARHLASLLSNEPTLFRVPDGVVLLPEFSVADDMQLLLHQLSHIEVDAFAVRSCGLHEDGASDSMAGKFHTELHVARSSMADAIIKVRQSFGEDESSSAVLIQEMINPDFAGVMFTRSPENYALASCEYTQGLADAVVSGAVEPIRADYGRWTGKLHAASTTDTDMLSRLFLVGLIIEERMGEPQDIEWAYESKRQRIYILQTRSITAQLYDADVADEQQRLADIALAGKGETKGAPVFANSAVREVVQAPTPFTQDLMQRLYSPEGALGRALTMLDLPCPKLNQAYILPVFGRLYANITVEKKIFGLSLKRMWAVRKLKRKVTNNPEPLLSWLDEQLTSFPDYPEADATQSLSAARLAQQVVHGVDIFVAHIYPAAYAATMLAQLADEKEEGRSLTSQMMHDLSRLFHTNDAQLFMQAWGLRSANDYELSEPRFHESEEATLQYAAQFAHVGFGDAPMQEGFVQRKELAKHLAVCWLNPMRQNMLALASELGIADKEVFYLNHDDLQKIANEAATQAEIIDVCQLRKQALQTLQKVTLADEVGLAAIEQLENTPHDSETLMGKMVSVRAAFQGRVRLWDGEADFSLEQGDIILTACLSPDLVGHYHQSVGCIADMGGALSHAAIVAREMTHPIIVLAGATKVLQDGDYVEVGQDGSIKISAKA